MVISPEFSPEELREVQIFSNALYLEAKTRKLRFGAAGLVHTWLTQLIHTTNVTWRNQQTLDEIAGHVMDRLQKGTIFFSVPEGQILPLATRTIQQQLTLRVGGVTVTSFLDCVVLSVREDTTMKGLQDHVGSLSTLVDMDNNKPITPLSMIRSMAYERAASSPDGAHSMHGGRISAIEFCNNFPPPERGFGRFPTTEEIRSVARK